MTINKTNVISEYYKHHDINILKGFLDNNTLNQIELIVLMQKMFKDESEHLPQEHHDAMILLLEKEEEVENLYIPHIKLYEFDQSIEKTPMFLSSFAFHGSYIQRFKSFLISKKINELLPEKLAFDLEKQMLEVYKNNVTSLLDIERLPCFEKPKREVFDDVVAHLIEDVLYTYNEQNALDIILNVLKEKLIGLTYLFHDDNGVVVSRYEIKDVKFRKTNDDIKPLIINHNNQEVLFKNAELDCWN